MKKVISVIILLFSTTLYAKQFKIAVIDTAFDPNYTYNICDGKIKKFNNDIPKKGHGHNIVSIIEATLKKADKKSYCYVLVDVGSNNGAFWGNFEKGLNYIRSMSDKPDVINISGGSYFNFYKIREETEALLNAGVKIFNAAGNNSLNLDKNCNWYPACYDKRIVVVGALIHKDNMDADGDRMRWEGSNYGENVVNHWEYGYKISAGGLTMTGTSMAVAFATGFYCKKTIKEGNYGKETKRK